MSNRRARPLGARASSHASPLSLEAALTLSAASTVQTPMYKLVRARGDEAETGLCGGKGYRLSLLLMALITSE